MWHHVVARLAGDVSNHPVPMVSRVKHLKNYSCAAAWACRWRQHNPTQRHDVTSQNTWVFQPVPPSRHITSWRVTSTDGQHSVEIFLLILAVSLSTAHRTANLGRCTILIDCDFPQTPQANSDTTASFHIPSTLLLIPRLQSTATESTLLAAS